MKSLAEAPELNLFTDEFRADPGAAIEAVRSTSPLARTPIGVLVLSFDDVQSLFGDRRLRSAVPELISMQGVTGDLLEMLSGSILATDGETHQRLRRLANRAFTPRAADRHRPLMREILGRILEPIATRGRTEFMADVADHYPIEVMCHVLGVPAADHEDFGRWARSITWILSLNLSEHLDEARDGMEQLAVYVDTLLTDRRRSPRDDLISAMILRDEAGDELTDDEVRGMVAGLIFAGFDTTRNQLGLAMWLFAQAPDQWAKLRGDPGLAAPAVEEVMRYEGAVGATARIALEDIDVAGYTVPAGTVLELSMSAGNHDPSAFRDPATFDITASRGPQLSFGGGPHYCLGASLARAEMQEALVLLATAMPDLALDGEPVWRQPLGIFGPENLPLRFG